MPRKTVTLRLAAAIGALLIGMAPAARAQIKIAVVGPITGSNATFGTQMKEGAEQAVADINAKGGVLGQKLVLEIGDDACDPKQAVSVANQMAERGVKVVIGHFCSSSSIPASKVYTEEGILQISPASTNPAYTDNGSWNTFRVCGRDDQQGAVAGKYIAEHFRGARVAILHDNSAYGKGLADETRKAMNAAGLKETIYTAYVPGERDYSALVSRLKEAGITVIYIGGYQNEAGLIIRQAKEQGMHVTLIGGDALVTKEFLGHHRQHRRRHADDIPAGSALAPKRGRSGAGIQSQRHRSRRLRALHLCGNSDLGGGGNESAQRRAAQGCRNAESKRPLAECSR